ncbi:hypothetical protein ACQJBY_009368 [Aegilops geniculata]
MAGEDLDSPLDEELMVRCLPQMSPTHVNISKRYILQQATNTLKLQITDHDILDMGEHGLIASLSINLPLHRGWAATKPKIFYGDFKSTSLEAAESANVAAISYLQENNIVVFDDANLQPLKKCRRELLQATSWSWGFEQCTMQLKKQVEAMERDRVQPLTLLLSSDDDSPNTPLLEELDDELVPTPEAELQFNGSATNTPPAEVISNLFRATSKLDPEITGNGTTRVSGKRSAKRALFDHGIEL